MSLWKTFDIQSQTLTNYLFHSEFQFSIFVVHVSMNKKRKLWIIALFNYHIISNLRFLKFYPPSSFDFKTKQNYYGNF